MVRGQSNRMRNFKHFRYAHRGLHRNGIPENSMRGFRDAMNKGYGIELDVHLISDGGLVVIHDNTLNRTTGVDRTVSKLTVDELSNIFLEGSSERLPQLYDVLNLVKGRVPLIIELKTENRNITPLCRAVCRELQGYNGDFCIQSFDPRCLIWFKKNQPDIIRGQLAKNFTKDKKLLPVLAFFITFLITNFITKPDFVAYNYNDRDNISFRIFRNLWKQQGIVWTIKDKPTLEEAEKKGMIVIFENFQP